MFMNNTLRLTAVALAFAGVAEAQTVSIGTNPQGSVAYATGSALAKVAIEQADIRMRVVPQGGPNVVVPIVNAGEMEFSIANGVVAANAYGGVGEFSRPNENIRVAAVLFPLYSGFMVRADSDINTLSDLAGRRLASDFLQQKGAQLNSESVLRTVGLTYDDVQRVPVPSGVRGVEDFEAGNVDATFFSLSSGRTLQADATIGGIRILAVENSDEALANLTEVYKGAWIETVEPGPNFPGIHEPTGAFTTPFVVLANANVSDDLVYDFIKALHDNKPALVAAAGAFEGFDPARMNADIGVPFHPGAERFFAEMGM
ncbi:TAXI family TRAP transporter solute-binding subunit [Roseinatronobacter alkalisoli]|uniref:TAXI family TRAP transporter solute-binding subunit n=1 Tax=Roseinatronobacter alkalisoli TaxID=3028235 RepID=A0ABT5TE89_9RHOB|nr:TAXI family TRAP transporter solute-binding subunit [Roseinatronobacter sp. HJB301]MDD7972691.1 TAXI family TRAP transporter solute-binding subunit [Roseinatronobacter sp. HJB301]